LRVLKLQGREEVVAKLDEAINLLDKLETFIGRLNPGDSVHAGLIYQLYESAMLLREKIIEARLMILGEKET